jgi:hypothetical protein
MAKYPVPVGSPTYFEGNYKKFQRDIFGFVYAKIISPSNLKTPILPYKVKNINGTQSTMMGVGN